MPAHAVVHQGRACHDNASMEILIFHLFSFYFLPHFFLFRLPLKTKRGSKSTHANLGNCLGSGVGNLRDKLSGEIGQKGKGVCGEKVWGKTDAESASVPSRAGLRSSSLEANGLVLLGFFLPSPVVSNSRHDALECWTWYTARGGWAVVGQ